MSILDLRSMRAAGVLPRVHGNGFIQLDLEQNKRLNVWGHKGIPRQKVDTGIHDHVFGFSSQCVAGRLINAVYEDVSLSNYGPYKIYIPVSRDGEDTVLQNTGVMAKAGDPALLIIRLWDCYTMKAGVFHESFTDRPSATLMEKGFKVKSAVARVLVPFDQEPDNEFNRNSFEPDKLWSIIKEVLGSDVEI